jgi:hypothetical protein
VQLFRAVARHAKPSRRKVTTVATGTAVVLALDLAGAATANAHDRSFPTMLRELRECESGNNYSINTGNGYYGAYQFNLQTWRGVGGTGYPHQNPPHVQDEMATRLYEQRGWQPWPSCSRSRGLHATTVERPWAGSAPTGALDRVAGWNGLIGVRGWAFDSDTPDPIEIHVYVDGHGAANVRADQSRPDVGQAHGRETSGFHAQFPASQGAHHVCVYAIGAGNGGNTHLGCRDIVVPRSPIGSLDEVTPVAGGVRVRGWTLDWDTPAQSTRTHVYVNGPRAADVVADQPRPDVARAYGVPEARGFDTVVPTGSDVCVYAIDTTGGAGPAHLGCADPLS